MLLFCRGNMVKLWQFDMTKSKYLGQMLRYASSTKYQVQSIASTKDSSELDNATNNKKSEINNITPSATVILNSSLNASTTSTISKEASLQQQQQFKQLLSTMPPTSTTTPSPTSTATATTTPSDTGPSSASTSTKPVHIPYNIDWVFAGLRRPSFLWYIGSQIAMIVVGLFSKFILVFMNKCTVHNKQRLIDAIAKRPKDIPLVTVSNHHSCFDDPGLWGVLPVKYVCNTLSIRWSMAAHDICFTNKYHSRFFMLGKCIPVIRGLGVYQEAIELCIQKVNRGFWVHVFPEGKVNMTKEEMRLKWGVGRIIYESKKVPIILPMWHEGMDEVLPNYEPYILKWGKRVTLNIGKPIDMNDFINDLKMRNVKEPEARKLITDKIQSIFHELRLETEELHKKNK